MAADGYVSAGGLGAAGWDGMGCGDRSDEKAMRVSSVVKALVMLPRHVLHACAPDNLLEKTR